MATAEFSKFAGILNAALSQHHLSGFEIAQLPSPPKYRMGEVIESEQQKEKRVKKNEQSLKDLCDIIKWIIHTRGISEGEER